MRRKHLLLLVIIWALIISSSFVWNYSLVTTNNNKLVLNKSQAFFNQILLSRSWNSSHGGVYVPITEVTTSNPYLKDSLRDIVSLDGKLFTKVNPAYMTRQISELSRDRSGLNFHITSLNPIRPANKADDWETEALKSFENGNDELIELIKDGSISQYRYMAPLTTEQSCLNCHAFQGYKLGQVRGGISVSYPSALYEDGVRKQLISFGLVHFLILIFGLLGLWAYYRMSRRYFLIIKNKNKELMQINASKDKFFSIIAHDLKGPFNIIMGYVQLLKKGYDQFDDAERKEFIAEIDKSSENTFELLESLLMWARSQNNKIELIKEPLNFKDEIHEIVKIYLPAAENKKLKIKVEVLDDIVIYADKFSLKTVVSNLLNNAIKFTPSNGIIKIHAIQNEHYIEISISDNGVGIQEEMISKLFRIEENVSTLGTNDEKGTGLGLLLCKEFIEKHDGVIWVESEVGKGSRFAFTIPNHS